MAAPNAAATNRPGKELSAAINAGSTPAAETQNQIAPLLAESGYMEKRPDGSGTQRLAKLTLAPAWSTGPGFWNRPELRLYVTVARWNDAANAGARLDGLSGLGDGRTRGTSWGVQLETWF